jgi:hypothetical protein
VWHERRSVAGDQAALTNPDARKIAIDQPASNDGILAIVRADIEPALVDVPA